jgi:hypothetical protein
VIKKDTIYQWRRKYVRENKSNVCPTLTANMGMGGHNVPIILDNLHTVDIHLGRTLYCCSLKKSKAYISVQLFAKTVKTKNTTLLEHFQNQSNQ